MKTKSLGDACRIRGSDPLVQSQCTVEISTVSPGSGLQDFSVADSFECASFLKNHGETAGNFERLLVMRSGLGGIGDRIRITQVIEYLGLAKAMTQIAIQFQCVG